MEAVFCEPGDQEAAARARIGDKAPIIVGAPFYRAEDYHQKYKLRRDTLVMREFADYTPRQFVDSTIAARLNGYVSGQGSREQIADDLARFELSAEASQHVARLVSHRR